MKILLVCVLLYELRAARAGIPPYRLWDPEEEPAQPENAARYEYSVPDGRSDERIPWIVEVDDDRVAPLGLGSTGQRKRTELGPEWIHVSPRSQACSCESEFEVRDLGVGHYPRYLTASYCKAKTCQSKFHSCRLLHYKVHVLRLRDSFTPSAERTENDLPESPLPESLRHKWQLKPISVPVACVSTSGNRRTR